MSSLPWARLLAAAARMGVPPHRFWGLSLKEWRLLMQGAAQPQAALGRADLDALSAQFPDGASNDRNE